jgi:hypothetical protein
VGDVVGTGLVGGRVFDSEYGLATGWGTGGTLVAAGFVPSAFS